MKILSMGAMFLVMLFFSVHFLEARHSVCKPSGKVKGKRPHTNYCNEEDNVCCIEGRYYTTYKCSPLVSGSTKPVLNLNGFEEGGDGYLPSKCDHKYHSDDRLVVALSTGWYNGRRRCFNSITISANGRSVNAIVVDECDSSMGCDAGHDYLPPCANNMVGASRLSGKPWGCLQRTGVYWMSPGQMPSINHGFIFWLCQKDSCKEQNMRLNMDSALFVKLMY